MSSYLRQTLATLVAALAATAVSAQEPKSPDSTKDPRSGTPVVPYVNAPIASIAAGAKGPNTEAAHAIVQALVADSEMKGSKITVTPEEKRVLLTGVTPTLRQLARAVTVATEHAGEGMVVNGLNTEQVYLDPGPTGLAELNPDGWEAPAPEETQAPAA